MSYVSLLVVSPIVSGRFSIRSWLGAKRLSKNTCQRAQLEAEVAPFDGTMEKMERAIILVSCALGFRLKESCIGNHGTCHSNCKNENLISQKSDHRFTAKWRSGWILIKRFPNWQTVLELHSIIKAAT